MGPETVKWFLGGHLVILVLILGQLLRIEKRLGQGASILELLQKVCPLLNGGVCHGEKKEMG